MTTNPTNTSPAPYTWASHYGGVILTRTSDGETVFLQPGDDTAEFLNTIERTNDVYTDADVISEYFIDLPDGVEIEYTLECGPEYDDPADHHASGDDEQDAADVAAIREAAEWNPWAWCTVTVTAAAKVGGVWFTARDSLGACSYDGPEDFKTGGYYDDMKNNARAALLAKLRAVRNALN